MSKRDPNRWIRTFNGRQFWPLDPRPEEVDIRDIAHALSLNCRFAGHCKTHYSVAEHSIRVADIVDPEFKLWALLHDASEAYLMDMPSPIKHGLVGIDYMHAETELMVCIAERFGLGWPMPKEVKRADIRLLVTEQRDLMDGAEPSYDVEPLRETICSATLPWTIEDKFLERFVAYGGK